MKDIIKELPIDGEVFEIKGHIAFLILPGNTAPGKSIPWVWYAPTLPGLPGSSENWMFEQFLEAGVAIAGIDVGESYGNPEGRRIYSALYEELTNKRGLSKKACLLARSRGGLMLYNWAVENPMSVCCIAGIYPVCNLTSYPGIQKASEAYNLSEETLKNELAKHNPIERLSGLAQAGVEIFHIHGDSDIVVPIEQNSAELYRRYVELGGKMELVVTQGQGHNMWQGFFQCQKLVDFVIQQLSYSGS